ncbi:hypothetical protein [uncultured Amaricoccus sp.]|uniref:hypothetical protein n=1 Tax=uncultured Amaricoccus sp. TaxID=339341 RepID=UPI00261A2949|nr:hypothetical protein [uncultured Amaricoccus sp.]
MSDIEDDIPEIEPEIEAPSEPSAEELARIGAAETEARKYGWKPEAEYTKAPAGWMDAERYLESPRTQVKILRDEVRARDQRFEALERASAVAQRAAREQEAARWQVELDRVREAKQAAVEGMDLAAYDAAAERQREIENQRPSTNDDLNRRLHESQARAEAAHGKERVEQALMEAGTISPDFLRSFSTRPEPYEALVAWHKAQEIARDPQAYVARIEADARAKAAPRRSMVDGGGLAGGSRDVALSADERAAALMFVKDGTFKSVEEYAAYSRKLHGDAR